MKKTEFRDVHGILLLDKPQGLSSNQAMQRARHQFRARKAGHTGSLDPLATGLLPICFGEATKIAGYLLGARKAYAAECRLGTTTTTDDSEGEVIETRAVPALSVDTIESALKNLRGRITQIPPIYSALKQGGVALYKRARRGEEIEVPSREVEVFRFDLTEHTGDTLKLQVECGSGTYVRSLVRDLGAALGCGAHLTALRRLWVEPFREPAMYTLQQLQALGESGTASLDALLLPLESALTTLPILQLDAAQAQRLRCGQSLRVDAAAPAPMVCALNPQRDLVALVEIGSDGAVRILRGFNPP